MTNSLPARPVKSMMMSARSAGPRNRLPLKLTVSMKFVLLRIVSVMRKPPSVPIWMIGGPGGGAGFVGVFNGSSVPGSVWTSPSTGTSSRLMFRNLALQAFNTKKR